MTAEWLDGLVVALAQVEVRRTLPCPFCEIDEQRVVTGNELAVAVCDRFPVNPGHTLVIPRRHVASWFEATPVEQAAIMALAEEIRAELEQQPEPPHGYNLGINIGEAAGQTVMHLHLHVIPRFHGDVDDPRGGVRHVVPMRGRYPFCESTGR